MQRSPVSFNGAKRLFMATAGKMHKRNLQAVPMRGGFRI